MKYLLVIVVSILAMGAFGPASGRLSGPVEGEAGTAGAGSATWSRVHAAVQVDETGEWLRVNGVVYKAHYSPQAAERRRLGEDDIEPVGSRPFWLDVSISLGLVCTAGMMAGLTMGFVSLDPTYLEILKRSGTAEQKAQ